MLREALDLAGTGVLEPISRFESRGEGLLVAEVCGYQPTHGAHRP